MKIGDAKILISDHSILARKQLKDMLSSFGAVRIIESANGQEAVELYREHTPDIIFLDIITPIKDGNTAISEIREINPQADIVVVSSIGTQSQVMHAILLGAKDFVQKPLNASQIELILNTRFEGGA
ncbi:MAG: response regulator [Lachnospiraceae bacterium]|nr:response regulator [Lachnospiraceae bacterium]